MKQIKSLRAIKIKCKGKSKEIQEKLFELDPEIKWSINGRKAHTAERKYLYITSKGIITYGETKSIFEGYEYKKVKAKDILAIKNKLKDFPDEIKIAMLDEQERQGNERNIMSFINCLYGNIKQGCFSWKNSEKEYKYWDNIITHQKFHKFEPYQIDLPKKHPLDNTVIKNTSKEFGKKLIEWWKEQGVDTNDRSGGSYDGCGDYIYYGLINGEFRNYSLMQVKKHNAKIIELPTQNKIYVVDDMTENEPISNEKKELIDRLYNEIMALKKPITPRLRFKAIETLPDNTTREHFDVFVESGIPFRYAPNQHEKQGLTIERIPNATIHQFMDYDKDGNEIYKPIK